MFQKRETESNYDIIIGPSSLIKGDIESEGSIRIDGKIFGNIKSLGNVIISENAYVKGDIFSVNAEIYGKCEGNVQVKGKINIHQNSTLLGDIIAKSFNTKEGSLFKGNCIVDPAEELIITIDELINPPQKETILVDFSKVNTNERNRNRNDKDKDKDNNYDKQNESKKA